MNPFPYLDDDDPRTRAEREEDAREDEARDRLVGYGVFVVIAAALYAGIGLARRWLS